MKVKVLQHHIDAGVKGSLRECPIALAIREQYHTENVFMACSFAGIDNVFWHTSETAQQFVMNFDEGEPVSPVELEFTPYETEEPREEYAIPPSA